MSDPKSYYFCGIGGSGMLPLSMIAHGLEYKVFGSDRGYDQGKTPEKFRYLKEKGITLFPQDGEGVKQIDPDVLIVSTAVEDSIPDVRVAKEQNTAIIKRAELLSQLFNGHNHRIAIAGTSGKTTVTGMIGFILKTLNMSPTVMNGGVFKNFQSDDPYCSALVGDGDIFVTEADESDGSIALYQPEVAVLNNIALDHKSMDELVALFSDFLYKSKVAVLNADHDGVMALKGYVSGQSITYSLKAGSNADIVAGDINLSSFGSHFKLTYQEQSYDVSLKLPGEHNIANALSALAACVAIGVSMAGAVMAIGHFEGIWRRLDVVGEKNGITVIDDFAHNPDKIAASLKTLKQFDGRLKIFFQPHGFGFLKLLWQDLADCIAAHLSADDEIYLVQPFYAGGTVDRSIDSSHVIASLLEQGVQATLCDDRDMVKSRILADIQTGDRIVVMGARDDTLHDFAKEIYAALA